MRNFPDGYKTARLLRAATRNGPAGRRIRAAIPDRLLHGLLGRGVLRLAASSTDEHREIAATLAAVIDERDYRTALAMASTAARRTDLRAEKIVSRGYRYLWICNHKAASRSIIATLRAADPDAELIRNRTLDETSVGTQIRPV